jgi:hypothetical protein
MGRRAIRIAGIVVTAALFAGAAPTQAAEPDWMRALRIRSEALNRIYGLEAAKPDWMRALRIRSEELNRKADASF